MINIIKKSSKPRWDSILVLRSKIREYQERVKVEEQPFNQVRNMVEAARRRKKTGGQFSFNESVLQTKGQIQAASLLLRLDTALLADFLSMKKLIGVCAEHSELFVNLAENRNESRSLINDAITSHRIMQQTEGNIYLAQLYALELQNTPKPSLANSLRDGGRPAISESERLCKPYPGQTRGLAEGTKSMLNGGAFYTPVTNEERMVMLEAIAREFTGTGHWYYCENGHPFTVGECGGAIELSRCLECGSAVGGRDYENARGVAHAHDLEERVREMQIQL